MLKISRGLGILLISWSVWAAESFKPKQIVHQAAESCAKDCVMKIIAFLFLVISSLNLDAAQTTTTSTATDFESGQPLKVKWALCQIVGDRERQEDAYCMMNGLNGDSEMAFAGVFDGHFGSDVSDQVAQLLPAIIQNRLSKGEKCNQQLLTESFEEMNQALDDGIAQYKGSTAATVLIDGASRVAHIAWAGDSRVYLIEQEKIIACTKDHTPSDSNELARIKGDFPKALVTGSEGKCVRLGGRINVSRGFGDKGQQKNGFICTPEIVRWDVTSKTMLLLCTDGFVDVSEYFANALCESFIDKKAFIAKVIQGELDDALRENNHNNAIKESLKKFDNYVCSGNCETLKNIAKLLCKSNYDKQQTARAHKGTNKLFEPDEFPYDNVTVLLIQLAQAAASQEKIQETVVRTEKVPTQEFVNDKNKSWLKYLVDIVVNMGS